MLGQGGDNEPGEVPASLCARHRVCLSPTGKGAETERRVGRGHGDPETILMRTSLRAGTIRAYMQKKWARHCRRGIHLLWPVSGVKKREGVLARV